LKQETRNKKQETRNKKQEIIAEILVKFEKVGKIFPPGEERDFVMQLVLSYPGS
jgi:hypothetical protein